MPVPLATPLSFPPWRRRGRAALALLQRGSLPPPQRAFSRRGLAAAFLQCWASPGQAAGRLRARLQRGKCTLLGAAIAVSRFPAFGTPVPQAPQVPRGLPAWLEGVATLL